MFRIRSLLLIPLFVVSSSPRMAQSAPEATPTPAPAPAPLPAIETRSHLYALSMNQLDDKRKLSAGDRLSFRVVEDREDLRPLMVTDSGEMEVPYIGRVPAAGKTCKQVAFDIKGLLEKDYYYRATVLLGLDLAAVKSPGRVYLMGQIRTQGPQDMPADEKYTLSKAILKAGGFADFADKKKVKLVRRGEGKPMATMIVDVVAIMEKGATDRDPVLEPDDLIVVPQRLVNF